MPNIALQEGEEYYINFEQYYNRPNMEYFVTSTDNYCSTGGIKIQPAEIVKEQYNYVLSGRR